MKSLKRFISSANGNVATITAIAILPIFLAAGIAVDYSRISNARIKLQNAADSAALTAAQKNELSDKERKQLAREIFDVNAPDYIVKKFKVDINKDEVIVTPTVDMPLAFMSIIGNPVHDVTVVAAANSGITTMEVALVLDVSGSMRAMFPNGKSRLEVLKQAAENLLTKIENIGGAKVSVSIVPFTMNVNVGKGKKSWVEGEDHLLFAGSEWKGCVFEQSKGNYVANSPNGKFHAMIWPPMPNGNGDGNQCVRNSSDGTNVGYANMTEAANAQSTESQFDGPNYNCVRHEILPLTNNFTSVRNHLNSLTAEFNQGTIIGPGVTWGLRTLSSEKPFSEGSNWASNAEKIMIVLTDGQLTTEIEFNQGDTCSAAQNSTDSFSFIPSEYGLSGSQIDTYGPKDYLSPYGFILDSDPFGTNPSSTAELGADLDNISVAACTEAKKKRNGNAITVYTIGVSQQTAPGTRVYNVLQNCATKPENHYFATEAESLEKTFEEIADKIIRLRLTH